MKDNEDKEKNGRNFEKEFLDPSEIDFENS